MASFYKVQSQTHTERKCPLIRSNLSSSLLSSSTPGVEVCSPDGRANSSSTNYTAFLAFFVAAAFWAAPTGLELVAIRGSGSALSRTMSEWMSLSAVLMAVTMFWFLVGALFGAYSQRVTTASCWFARLGMLLALAATLSVCLERVGVQDELVAAGHFTENLEEMAAVWLSALAFLVTGFPWAYSELNRPGL